MKRGGKKKIVTICDCCKGPPTARDGKYLFKYRGVYLCSDCLFSDSDLDEMYEVAKNISGANCALEWRAANAPKVSAIHWPSDHEDMSYSAFVYG